MENKIKMAVKKAKMKMHNSSMCCDKPAEENPKLYLNIEEAENGYVVRMNGTELVAEDKDKVLEIVTEMLS